MVSKLAEDEFETTVPRTAHRRRTCVFYGLLLAMAGLALTARIYADTTPAEDPALTAAKLKTELEQSKADLLKAQNDAFKNQIGELSADNLQKGNIAASSLSIEGKMLAYRSAEKVAELIATAVLTAKPATVVFYSDKDLQALNEYQAFTTQVALLELNFTQLHEPISRPVPQRCPGPVGSTNVAPLLIADAAITLIGLLKTDITLTGQEVTLDDFGVASLVISQLLAKKVKVIYPPSYYPNVFAQPQSVTPNVYVRLKKLRDSIQVKVDKFTPVKADLDKLLANSKCTFWKEESKKVNNYLADLTKTTSIVDDVMANLMKADSTTSVPKLATYVRAEQMAVSATDKAYILQIKPIAAGGISQITKNILYSTLSFSGGATLSYMLFEPSGDVVQANTLSWYGGYVKAGDLAEGPVE